MPSRQGSREEIATLKERDRVLELSAVPIPAPGCEEMTAVSIVWCSHTLVPRASPLRIGRGPGHVSGLAEGFRKAEADQVKNGVCLVTACYVKGQYFPQGNYNSVLRSDMDQGTIVYSRSPEPRK